MSDTERPRGAHFSNSACTDSSKCPNHDSHEAASANRTTGRMSPDETMVYIRAAQSRNLTDSLVPSCDACNSERSQPLGSPSDCSFDTSAKASEDDSAEKVIDNAEKSSNMVSILVIISRITGFFRTVVQAWALGALGVASAYTVADQMPNVLYELVCGGMLITSFLPVYLKVKRGNGEEAARRYANNLISIVTLAMIALTVLGLVFAGPVILTQSTGASADFDFDLSVWFFRWFAVEIVLYALSSIFSGILNAERRYFASNFVPILNNVILISGFVIYAYLVDNGILQWREAVIVLAIANPLGVAVQAFAQIPALKRQGFSFSFKPDFHDPALRDTLSIGLPTLVVTLASFPTTAVMSSCALSVTAAGASISYYARVWYVLPFSIFAIPISVTLFTELSHFAVSKNMAAFKDCVALGVRRLFFTLIPLSMFLIVFSGPLIAIFTSGKFDADAASMTATYLAALSVALPFYGLSSYLQKVCSSLLRMRFYAIATCIAAVVQIVICIVLTPVFGLYVVPLSSTAFYGLICLVILINLRAELGPIGLRGIMVTVVRALLLGAAGSIVGYAIDYALTVFHGPCSGMFNGALYAVAGGVPALIVTFGIASALHISEAPFFDALFTKVDRIFSRRAK